MPLSTDVLVVGTLSTEEADRLRQAFGHLGLAAELREVPPRRSVGDFAWMLLAALPLKPFFDQLVHDAAADAYKGLKRLVGIVVRRHDQAPEHPKVLVLQDSSTGIQVVLESDLSDEAYEQLLKLDLGAIRRGPVHYDRHRCEWRSELDEADKSASRP
jgi:hypothetical protein